MLENPDEDPAVEARYAIQEAKLREWIKQLDWLGEFMQTFGVMFLDARVNGRERFEILRANLPILESKARALVSDPPSYCKHKEVSSSDSKSSDEEGKDRPGA